MKVALPAGDTKSDVQRLSDMGIDTSGYLPSDSAYNAYWDYPGYADYSAVASEDEVRTRSERRERAERLERELRDRARQMLDIREREERERQAFQNRQADQDRQAEIQRRYGGDYTPTRYSRRTAQGAEQMRQQAQRLRQYQTYGRGIRADGQYGQTDGQWKVPEEGIMFTTSIGGRPKQVTADQQFLMKLGIAANGNVNIQSFVMFGDTQSAFRLYCNRCSATQTVANPSVFSDSKAVAPELVDFCLAHRHDGGLGLDCQPETTLSEAPTGRMFRDDE